ncbi:MAG: asparaginase [Sphingomonadales bacterium]
MTDRTTPILATDGELITIAVTRGDLVESRHRVMAVVADAQGRIVAHWGDAATPVYARSTVKPFQALPLVLSGAMEAFGLDDRHLALASASHTGESLHVDLVAEWLGRIGLDPTDLECGATDPADPETARAVIRAGGGPRPDYNNCSGKHTGFLTLARHRRVSHKGYIDYDHPVQAEVRSAMSVLLDRSLVGAAWGIDGCGIPTYVLPLGDLARGFARFADPAGLSHDMRTAAGMVMSAMTAHPELVGGQGRFDSEGMACQPGALMIKSGAEGMCAASVPGRGLGIVTKVVDGAHRASDVAMGAVLRHLGLLDDADWERLQPYCQPVVHNVVGREVGIIQACGHSARGDDRIE